MLIAFLVCLKVEFFFFLIRIFFEKNKSVLIPSITILLFILIFTEFAWVFSSFPILDF